MKKQSMDDGFDVDKLIEVYMKSNYRIIGKNKHSAIKPCHWLKQKLLTGRDNRNCYKGYFGIPSECCIQNTPALPFCNHQCVFCWRDIENSTFGSEWKGSFDSPKVIVSEMIRHSNNLIFEHITKEKSLENLEIMHQVLKEYLNILISNRQETVRFDEKMLARLLNISRAKIHRAVLLLKNCGILINPSDDDYILNQDLNNKLYNFSDIVELIKDQVTTKEEIEQVFENAKQPKHAAISLAGEPTLYPRIGELVAEFRSRGFCTFIVTNGTQPKVIRNLWKNGNLPTQLYVTLPAPTKLDFIKICRPISKNTWEKLMETIEMIPKLPCRTVIRITAVKYLNIEEKMISDYLPILNKATPDFIDIKGFTVEAHALELENRLGKFAEGHSLRDFAPSFNDLHKFAEKLCENNLFEIIKYHKASKDILIRGKWPKEKSIEIDFNNP